jgi:hypothetical protein
VELTQQRSLLEIGGQLLTGTNVSCCADSLAKLRNAVEGGPSKEGAAAVIELEFLNVSQLSQASALRRFVNAISLLRPGLS